MTVSFELDGQEFTALNGGPVFKISEAVSFVIHCDTQAEVQQYWENSPTVASKFTARDSGIATAWPGRSCPSN